MTNEEALDIIEAIKEYSNNDEAIYYPLVSYMCRKGYIKNWKCVNDNFYIDGKLIA
jgi:hypothetical protein